MADSKISALTEVTAPASTDVIPIVNDGATKKVQIANLFSSTTLNAPGFAGVGATPAVLPNGLLSPWTQTRIVDIGGKGDFASIRAACVYVAAQSPSANVPWEIVIKPGVYTELALTVPPYTTLHGIKSGINPDIQPHNAVQIFNDPTVTGGAFITMGSFSTMNEIDVWAQSISSQSADLIGVLATDWGEIRNCWIIAAGITASGFNVATVKNTGTWAMVITNSALHMYDASFHATKGIIAWSTNHGISMGNCLLNSLAGSGIGFYEDGGASNIYFCRFGPTLPAKEIYINSGSVTVNNTPYKNPQGTPIHFDRWFPSTAAIREAPAATDTPLILTPAAGQTAALMTASGNTIVDKNGKIVQVGLPVYANNAAALAAGLLAGAMYRTNGDPDQVCVVH